MPADAVEVRHIWMPGASKGGSRYSLTAPTLRRFFFQALVFVPAEKGVKTFDGVGKIAIKEARTRFGYRGCVSREVDDRAAADGLRGARVFISHASFPTIKKTSITGLT